MYGQPNFQNQIVSKKNHKIDEEDPKGKKGKKGKKNKQQHSQDDHNEEIIGSEKQKPGGTVKQPTNHDKPSDQKIFTDLCALLPDYKEGTILKILQETNFDKGEAYAKLLMNDPDNEKENEWMNQVEKSEKFGKKEPSEERSTSSAPSENANALMNEVFDTLLKEEINGREFQELFEEIAEMVKEDQEDRGVGIIEINSFVDQCNEVKQTLLVGFREQLSNFDDFEIDSNSLLYAEIQKFVENIITQQVKMEKKIQEDFPSLDSGYRGQKSIVDRIKQENKKKKEQVEYFTPSQNMMPKFARQKNNQTSVFNVDNSLASQNDLITLHRNFQDVPIIDLKFIYKTLAGDYNRTVQFLNKHYNKNVSSKTTVKQIKTVTYNKPTHLETKIKKNHMKSQQIDKELQHWSLDELREEIDHLYKLKQAFQLTKMKIKNTNQRKELDRICGSNEPLLRKLSQAARVKTAQMMAKSNPLYVDLHGWREDEIDDLFDVIWSMLNQEANRGNEKIRPRMLRGQRTVCLTAMTGKGIHSKGKKSVLKPVIKQWCQGNKIFVQQEEDHLKVYMVIN